MRNATKIELEVTVTALAKILNITVGLPFKVIDSDDLGDHERDCVLLSNGTMFTINNGAYFLMSSKDIGELIENRKDKFGYSMK